MQIKLYAAKSTSEEVRTKSRSGGVFTAVSDEILENGGVVYGCVLDQSFRAIHSRATSKEERDLMRGSKYIQSKIGDCYKDAKTDLDNGKKVLFTGTSCQIAGLRRFLMKDYDNLYCLDILCHGAPSPLIWEKYLKWTSKRLKSPITKVDFRNKIKFGWKAHYETITGENNKDFDSRVFTNLFYGENIVRPSCYECKYTGTSHPGDITIGDYWGIEKACPAFDDNKGVSLVILNSPKGCEIFDKIKDNLVYAPTKLEDSWQQVLKEPFPRPKTREQFWIDYKKHSFSYLAYKYGDYGYYNVVKKKVGYKLLALKRKLGLGAQ